MRKMFHSLSKAFDFHNAPTLLVALLLALLAPGAASANPWEISFGVGSADLGSGDDANLELRGDVRAGFYLTERFQLEAQRISGNAVLDASFGSWMANAVLDLRSDKAIVPYVLAGAGWAEVSDYNLFSNTSINSDGSAYQAAIGTRFFFGNARRMGARVELSRLWEETDLFAKSEHTSLSAGMTWVLGR